MRQAIMKAPRKRLSCEVVEISPAQATEMLRANTHNRSMRRPYVRRLAEAMQRGEWTINGEPIQIATDGTVLNGQHRLQAVVESGETVPMLVVRGLAVDAQRTMDTGSRRNLADVLALRHEPHATHLAAALALLHRFRKGVRLDSSGHTAPTPQEALDLLSRERGVRDRIPLAHKVYRETQMRISVTIVLAYLFDEFEPGRGSRFFEALCIGDSGPPGSPLRALRDLLDQSRNEQTYFRAHTLFALTVKAFNAWHAGRTVTELKFRGDGEKPEPLPAIGAGG
jgi:hypothetical protein